RTCVEESAVVPEFPIMEEPSEHGKGARSERLVDKRFLPFQRFRRRTTGQRILATRCISDLGVQLTDGTKPGSFTSVSLIQRLAKHKLPARRIVTEIEPVGDGGRGFRYRPLDHVARSA